MRTRHAWTSALLAIFLVALFPSCFYGALQRAQVITNNTEEEHRDHQQKAAEHSKLAARAKPPIVAVRRQHVVSYLRSEQVPPPRFVTRYIPHPSRFSERRLI